MRIKKGRWNGSRRPVSRKAPRDDHSANNSFIEVGLCLVTTSRKERNVHLLPWGDLSASLESPKSAKAKHDPLARARFYQSLLDNEIVESRAALARHLGVSRARVTQVLRRLKATEQPGKCDGREAS